MKSIYILILGMLCCFHLDSYAQNSFQYQATLNSNKGLALANKNVSITFSIIKDSETGETVYSEVHNTQTNNNGSVDLKIGSGQPTLGSFQNIQWESAEFFIKTVIDKGEGNPLISIQQLQTVPYALHAEKAGGIRQKLSDGTYWEITVDNNGNLSASKVEETIIPIPPGFSKLVFNDEFNGTGLPDSEKWNYEEGYVRNGEEQYYTKARLDNCFQEDGYLHIRLLNDNMPIPLDKNKPEVLDGIAPYTSASITTQGKESWMGCKIEVRAKLPMCLGTWPAIWMLPVKGGWPAGGEIDIMEQVGYDPDYIHFSLHSQKYNGNNNTHKYRKVFAPTTYTEFHTYGLEWHEDRIEWYFDGKKRFTVNNDENTPASWPFNLSSFYVMLNLAFGGGWGGREGIDPSALPQEYLIDYIRVFQ